jgi:rhodanese-related sulfurtransferase
LIATNRINPLTDAEKVVKIGLFGKMSCQPEAQREGADSEVIWHFWVFLKGFSMVVSGFTRFVAMILVAIFMSAAQAQTAPPVVTLDAARKAHEMAEVLLIDIREPSEHASGVAKGALLLPMSQINQRLAEIPKASDKPVYLICNTQNRSARVVSALHRAGYTHTHYVHGGMAEWAKRGWPMVLPTAVAPK